MERQRSDASADYFICPLPLHKDVISCREHGESLTVGPNNTLPKYVQADCRHNKHNSCYTNGSHLKRIGCQHSYVLHSS